MPFTVTTEEFLRMCGFPADEPAAAAPSIEDVPAGGICPYCWNGGEVLVQGDTIVLAYCPPCGVQWHPSAESRAMNIHFRDYRLVQPFLPKGES